MLNFLNIFASTKEGTKYAGHVDSNMKPVNRQCQELTVLTGGAMQMSIIEA